MKSAIGAAGPALLGVAATAHAQNEQFIAINGYRVGPYARRRRRILQRLHRLPHAGQRARRRRQRRQAVLGRVRDRVQQHQGRGVLRAPQDEGRDRPHRHPSDVHRHHVRADRQRTGGQDSARSRSATAAPTPCDGRVFPWVFPLGHQLLGRSHRPSIKFIAEGRRDGQAQGQEDRAAVSRLGLRQGAAPGAGRRGRQAGLRRQDDPGAASGQRAAVAVAADPAVSGPTG